MTKALNQNPGGKKMSLRQAIKKGGQLAAGAAAGACMTLLGGGCGSQAPDPEVAAGLMAHSKPADLNAIRITVVYDNLSYDRSLVSDWGFSCLVQGLDRTILFDTGRQGDALMANMAKMGLDPGTVDDLVISHDHPDHTGGARALLDQQPHVTVSLVDAFRFGFKDGVNAYGAGLREVGQPVLISENCLSTGEMTSLARNEHGLIIRTCDGLILITGCAHPGVADMARQAIEITGETILLVMGGFHLLNTLRPQIQKVADQLKAMGVGYVAPSHCSGPDACQILSQAFGDRCLASGAGRVFTARDFWV